MDIQSAGFIAKELAPNRASVEQELTQRAQDKGENAEQVKKPLEPRPVDQTGNEKLGRIDIYV